MRQVVPPIAVATTYKQAFPGESSGGDGGGGYDYARVGNPSRDVLQEALAALEDALYCRVFSSDLSTMAAITNLFKSGDHIICSDDVYGGICRAK